MVPLITLIHSLTHSLTPTDGCMSYGLMPTCQSIPPPWTTVPWC